MTLRAESLQGGAAGKRDSACGMSLLLAAEKGDLDAIRSLVASGADVGKTNQDGWTPLMCAARHGHAGVVHFFLSQNANPATLDKAGWNALMIAAYYGHREIVKTIINAEPGGQEPAILFASLIAASGLDETALLHAIVLAAKGSNQALDSVGTISWAIQKDMRKGFLEALADADLTLSPAQHEEIVGKYSLPIPEADYLYQTMVEGELSGLAVAAMAYADNKHLEVDDYFRPPAPDGSRGNALGLTTRGMAQFAHMRHATDAAGPYRHAIGRLRDDAPRPETLFPLEGLLLMGWRSRITQLINEAYMNAEAAASRAAKLLSGQEGRIVLTDANGNVMATSSIQFKETLFAFQLRHNEHLNQLAVPPQDAAGGEQEKAAAGAAENTGDRRLAMQAQAQCLLELNDTYVPLALHMPSSVMPLVSMAKAIEAEVRSGRRTDFAAALAEVQALVLETERLFDGIMKTEQGLVQHWFLVELTKLLDGMDLSCRRIKSFIAGA